MDTNYSVNEGDGSVTVTILVRGGTNQCNQTQWVLKHTIRNISAQCEHLRETCTWMVYSTLFTYTALKDYHTTNLEGTIYVNATQPASVIIPIVDDKVLELDETFQVEISLQNSEDRNCVILQPNVVDITILDDDSES